MLKLDRNIIIEFSSIKTEEAGVDLQEVRKDRNNKSISQIISEIIDKKANAWVAEGANQNVKVYTDKEPLRDLMYEELAKQEYKKSYKDLTDIQKSEITDAFDKDCDIFSFTTSDGKNIVCLDKKAMSELFREFVEGDENNIIFAEEFVKFIARQEGAHTYYKMNLEAIDTDQRYKGDVNSEVFADAVATFMAIRDSFNGNKKAINALESILPFFKNQNSSTTYNHIDASGHAVIGQIIQHFYDGNITREMLSKGIFEEVKKSMGITNPNK